MCLEVSEKPNPDRKIALLVKLSKIKQLKIIFPDKLVVEDDTDIGYLHLSRISGQNRIYRGRQ